jgi:hypothetical protein
MRKLTLAVALAALITGVTTVGGHGEARSEEKGAKAAKADAGKVKALMRRKVTDAQGVLEALALNDLPKAAKFAEDLLRVRRDPHWRVFKTEQYNTWSEEFRRAAEGIVRAAKDKNLESAKLQYLGLTLACFNCHTYVRDQGTTSARRTD